MIKSLHVGHAARVGVDAAWLARNGFDANPSIFEGPDGVFAVYGGKDGITPDDALAALGNPWCLLNPGVSLKRWPCCFGAHRPLGGIFKLIEENDIRAEDVEAVKVHFLPMSDKALTHLSPTTGMEAKFSMEYCAAAALLDREITLDSFTDEKVQRLEARNLMRKVERIHVPGEGSFNAHHGHTDIEIVTRKGTYAGRADKTPGSLAWPLSKAEIRQKFIGCARLLNGQTYAEAVFEALDGLGTCRDVGSLVASALGDPDLVKSGKQAAHADA
jgi:2-methylcitrate dehydratase PrpD